jgi:hypothetical protein
MPIFTTQIKLLALTGAIAVFGYQPNLQADMRLQPALNPTASNPARPALSSVAPPMASEMTSEMASETAPFVAVAHPTTGAARVIEMDGQRYLELDAAFSTEPGPDVFVLLHAEAVPETYSSENYVNLGPMQQAEGIQRYAIPPEVDLAMVNSAVIWCRQFDVTFGYAPL